MGRLDARILRFFLNFFFYSVGYNFQLEPPERREEKRREEKRREEKRREEKRREEKRREEKRREEKRREEKRREEKRREEKRREEKREKKRRKKKGEERRKNGPSWFWADLVLGRVGSKCGPSWYWADLVLGRVNQTPSLHTHQHFNCTFQLYLCVYFPQTDNCAHISVLPIIKYRVFPFSKWDKCRYKAFKTALLKI